MAVRAALVAAVMVAMTAAPVRAATCPTFDGVSGTNPAPSELAAEIAEVAAARDVPATILAAIAYVEGYDPATARNWVQFEADGSPLVSADCGIGLMQITDATGFETARLGSDWRYNLDAGAQVLASKWAASQAANPAALGADDPDALENWWAAVYRYNGTGAAAAAYADRVFAAATDPGGEAAVFTPWLPTLRTPTQVFASYTTDQQFQARDTEAVLADDTGAIVERDTTFRPTAVPAADRPPAPRVAADATTAQQAGVQLSRVVFADDGARHAVLARDDDWADSLAGAALAGDWGPVLYADGGAAGTLPEATLAELERVLVSGGTVYLLGGTAALSPAVEAAVAAAGLQPDRLAGTDRLSTAMAIAREVRRLDTSATEVLVARGYDSPADALTGGAAAGADHRPLVLTPTASMPQSLRDEVAALGPRTAIVLGGTAAVSEQVVNELRAAGLAAERVAGTDRYATAAAIATRLWGAVARDAVAVDLASADGWAWALAAGSLAALVDGPQLGVAPSSVPAPTLDAIRAAGGTSTSPVRVVVVGSATRASTAVRSSLRDAADG